MNENEDGIENNLEISIAFSTAAAKERLEEFSGTSHFLIPLLLLVHKNSRQK